MVEQASSSAADENKPRRAIRSYVVRGGRLTPGQQRARDRLWPRYGVDFDTASSESQNGIDQLTLFGREAPLVLEVGFGMGEALLEMAGRHPQENYIGVDVHPPGIGNILRGIEEKGLDNLRVFQHDAIAVLRSCVAEEQLDRVQVFFPDPWHKKKHHKRRIIQPAFVQLLRSRLKLGGSLHIATDWENYAEHILSVLSVAEGFENAFGAGQFASDHDRPLTKFESRGHRLGHKVQDMIFTRVA